MASYGLKYKVGTSDLIWGLGGKLVYLCGCEACAEGTTQIGSMRLVFSDISTCPNCWAAGGGFYRKWITPPNWNQTFDTVSDVSDACLWTASPALGSVVHVWEPPFGEAFCLAGYPPDSVYEESSSLVALNIYLDLVGWVRKVQTSLRLSDAVGNFLTLYGFEGEETIAASAVYDCSDAFSYNNEFNASSDCGASIGWWGGKVDGSKTP